MARRSGLGRGLGALIPNEVVADRTTALREVPIASITPNPLQPRRHFDEEQLASLSDSIRELGVLQPILVREVGEGAYELIAGERRWRASRRAGLTSMPVLVRVAEDAAVLEQALVENLHRQDLNALEEAAAYQQLIDDFGLTHEEVAKRVGKNRVTITNALRLFQLPPSIQKLVIDGQIQAGHARALLGTPDRAFQESLAKRAAAESMSVRQVEEAIRLRSELGAAAPSPEAQAKTRKLRQPGVEELEQLLSAHLETRVAVDMGAKRGRVVIEFADLDDLERVYLLMTGGGSHPA